MKSKKTMIWLIIFITMALSLCTRCPTINNDSVWGFEAMNGYEWTGKFNTILMYRPHAPVLQEHFVTWWSPGQYIAPAFFMKVFHLKLGWAILMTNFICIVLGTIGFMLVFEKFGFEPAVRNISAWLIMFSYVVLQRYYSYQGGESLNFFVFPWIILLRPFLKKKYVGWILSSVLLFVAFISKLQLLIIVPPLILILIIVDVQEKSLKNIIAASFPFAVSLVITLGLIYGGFISRGSTPASFGIVLFNPLNFLVPLASPLTCLPPFDIINNGFHTHFNLQIIYLLALSLIVGLMIRHFVKDRLGDDTEKRMYKCIVISLYLFSALFFSILYTKGSKIDYSVRHFKLISFLFYPLFIEWLFQRAGRRLANSLIGLIIFAALFNHVRLIRVWLSDTSETSSGFRLSQIDLDVPAEGDMPLALKEKLDTMIKTKTVVISQYRSRYAIDNALILPIQKQGNDSTNIADIGYPILYVDSLRQP